jgi:hypothetical protein
MTISSSTLRPGLLVSLKSTIRGNVTYTKKTIDEKKEAKGSKLRWETVRTITDNDEHERAVVARTKCRVLIASVCAASAFGLLCPEDREKDLATAIEAARKEADEFNKSAKYSHLGVYVMTGRIAQDDVEAVKAINSEVRDLLRDMQSGIKSLDVKAIREAARKARNLGAMLTPEAEKRIKDAIDAARGVARDIVKAGETAGVEIDKESVKRITQARTAFLDIEVKPVRVGKGKGRAVDLAPVDAPKPVKAKRQPARQVELEPSSRQLKETSPAEMVDRLKRKAKGGSVAIGTLADA